MTGRRPNSRATRSRRIGWPELPDLPRELDALLAQIPAGRVASYGDLARALGDVRAARWVGERLLDHPHDDACPCHRVIRTGGEIGLYVSRNSEEKAGRLAAEGHAVAGGRIESPRWMTAAEFQTERPLERLLAFQDAMRSQLDLTTPLPFAPRMFCGLDVAYPRGAPAVGAAVLLDAATLQPVWSTRLLRPAAFPYLPGYLSFREAPLLVELWEQACAAADPHTVCFVDGNGILHPRRAGVASCFGLLAQVPTVGIGKSLLCGREAPERSRSAWRPVEHQGEVIAAALRRDANSRPIYVSPGNLISLEAAVELARRCLTGRRLPEPVYHADRLSKQRGAHS